MKQPESRLPASYGGPQTENNLQIPPDLLLDSGPAATEYRCVIGNIETFCEAWAVDRNDYPNRIAVLSVIGRRSTLEETRRLLIQGRMYVHLYPAGGEGNWLLSLDTMALQDFTMVPLPGFTEVSSERQDTEHHLLALPQPTAWHLKMYGNIYRRKTVPSPATQDQMDRDLRLYPIYFALQEPAVDLPRTVGNILRENSSLICPPPWDQTLTRICWQQEWLIRMEAWNCHAYSLKVDVPKLQKIISATVRKGDLTLT